MGNSNILLRLFLVILVIFWATTGNKLAAQPVTKPELVSNALRFNDGIYLQFESFRNNRPDYTWEELLPSAYVNLEKYTARFEYIKVSNDSLRSHYTDLDLNQIWGICVNGLPFIRLFDAVKQQHQFIGLRTRGRLCLLSYNIQATERVPMKVHNPYDGKMLYESSVENQVSKTVTQILSFETGELVNFDVASFTALIASDTVLSDTFKDLSPSQALDKLHKSLLIFNDRNPIYIR